jgi:hypothetical protein
MFTRRKGRIHNATMSALMSILDVLTPEEVRQLGVEDVCGSVVAVDRMPFRFPPGAGRKVDASVRAIVDMSGVDYAEFEALLRAMHKELFVCLASILRTRHMASSDIQSSPDIHVPVFLMGKPTHAMSDLFISAAGDAACTPCTPDLYKLPHWCMLLSPGGGKRRSWMSLPLWQEQRVKVSVHSSPSRGSTC